MQSWSLKKFVDEYGCKATGELWGVSHQAVSLAVRTGRDIQIIRVNGYYEVVESKILMRVRESNVQL